MAKASKIFEKLVIAADLPDEPIPGLPLIEIAGDRRVLIENHFGVCEYSDQTIRVKVKYGSVCISGSDLILAKMTKGQLTVSGKISGVVLEKGRM